MDFMVLGVKWLGRWLGWIKFAWSIIWRGTTKPGYSTPLGNRGWRKSRSTCLLMIHDYVIVHRFWWNVWHIMKCLLFGILYITYIYISLIMFIDYTIDIGIYWNILWSIQYHLAVIWRCPMEVSYRASALQARRKSQRTSCRSCRTDWIGIFWCRQNGTNGYTWWYFIGFFGILMAYEWKIWSLY